jgi:AbrB family looped-hinge helix DNA binding protein
MKVGPKGQVVIPSVMRKALKIYPGSKVVVRLEGEKLSLEKPRGDSVAVFLSIARKGESVKGISAHLYEEELKSRQ